MRTWVDELRLRYPRTAIIDGPDVADWEAEFLEHIPDIQHGEIAKAIAEASYREYHDGQVTPPMIVAWIRKARAEQDRKRRPDAAAITPMTDAEREAASRDIRRWIAAMSKGGPVDSIDSGYRSLRQDELSEPDDEFWSVTAQRWVQIGEGRYRSFEHRRRRIAQAVAAA